MGVARYWGKYNNGEKVCGYKSQEQCRDGRKRSATDAGREKGRGMNKERRARRRERNLLEERGSRGVERGEEIDKERRKWYTET